MKSQGEVEYHPMIRDLPAWERPRERLLNHGVSALSNAELLAIVLRPGSRAESVLAMSIRLLAQFGGDPTHQNWEALRPLRLRSQGREEDWSDWLAYLIQSSDTGTFSCILFGGSPSEQSNYSRVVPG